MEDETDPFIKRGLSTFCFLRAQAHFPDFKNLEAIVLYVTMSATLLKHFQSADLHRELLHTGEDSSLLRTFEGTVLFGYCVESIMQLIVANLSTKQT